MCRVGAGRRVRPLDGVLVCCFVDHVGMRGTGVRRAISCFRYAVCVVAVGWLLVRGSVAGVPVWAAWLVGAPVAVVFGVGAVSAATQGRFVVRGLVRGFRRYGWEALEGRGWGLVGRRQRAALMTRVAYELQQAGDLAGAEEVYRRAADLGSDAAALNLGLLLGQRGRLAEAAPLIRQAWEAGRADLAVVVGHMAVAEGAEPEGERLFRRALAQGDPRAALPLGSLLEKRGALREAEAMFRQAAERAGNAVAMFRVGLLRDYLGDAAVAGWWYRRAARAGSRIGVLAAMAWCHWQGDDAQAARWCREAVEGADAEAADVLRLLRLMRDEDGGRIEADLRAMAATGDAGAMATLGLFLRSRDDVEGAAEAVRQVAALGHETPWMWFFGAAVPLPLPWPTDGAEVRALPQRSARPVEGPVGAEGGAAVGCRADGAGTGAEAASDPDAEDVVA